MWGGINMFGNQRYMTSGIESSIPPEVILLLWQLIDERRMEKDPQLDYLQVFRLSVQDGLQVIEHSQEQPPYTADYTVKITAEAVDAKIYVIDDISHSTMLLAGEY